MIGAAIGGLGGFQPDELLSLGQLQAERAHDIHARRAAIYGSNYFSPVNKEFTFKEELQDEIDQWLKDI